MKWLLLGALLGWALKVALIVLMILALRLGWFEGYATRVMRRAVERIPVFGRRALQGA